MLRAVQGTNSSARLPPKPEEIRDHPLIPEAVPVLLYWLDQQDIYVLIGCIVQFGSFLWIDFNYIIARTQQKYQ
ncbi:hypothetical protein D3C79_897730 [compost metagenome]